MKNFKHLLFFAAIMAVASITFVAYGQTQNKKTQGVQTKENAPVEGESVENNARLQLLAAFINAEASKNEGNHFVASVRGNSLVLTGEMNEPDGMTVGSLAKDIKDGGDLMTRFFAQEMISVMGEAGHTFATLLRENKINLIMHFIGKQSREEGEIVIRYDLLP